MSEGTKKDSGKPAMHLLTWGEFNVTDRAIAVEEMYEGLKAWWAAKPFKLDQTAVPRSELVGVARVLAFGAAKYAERNWEQGIRYSRIFAAACRHAEAWAAGDAIDRESGELHSSHFWCNVMFLATFAARGRDDLDDRPAPVAAVVKRIEAVGAALQGRTEALERMLADAMGLNPDRTPNTPKPGKGGVN